MIYIALLRGINVGGKSSLPMKELVEIFNSLGLQQVHTYIQSGNVIFLSPVKDKSSLAQRITLAIHQSRGISPLVVLLTLEELRLAVQRSPFTPQQMEGHTLHLEFLADRPGKPDLEKLGNLRAAGESFALLGDVFYLLLPAGFSQSKVAANSEKALGVPVTIRKWDTILKVLDLAEELNRKSNHQ